MWIVSALTVIGCSDRQSRERTGRASPVETAIARDLTARFGTSVSVSCKTLAGAPTGCTAKLADGTPLSITIENAGKDEWGWRIDGRVVESKAIVAYVQDQLATFGIKQTATCGAPIAIVKAGERIACTLSGGGAAFVQVAADGNTTLELELDAASAAARSELVTPERDRQLSDISKGLETLEGESDGEEAVPTDGGAPPP
jgi:hypothetical protein